MFKFSGISKNRPEDFWDFRMIDISLPVFLSFFLSIIAMLSWMYKFSGISKNRPENF